MDIKHVSDLVIGFKADKTVAQEMVRDEVVRMLRAIADQWELTGLPSPNSTTATDVSELMERPRVLN